jgi:hypothetical protein
VVPPTCVSVNTRHTTSILGATTTTRGRRLHYSLHTFYYGGLRRCNFYAWRHGLALGKGSGLPDSWRRVFFSSHHVGFLSFPRQIS